MNKGSIEKSDLRMRMFVANVCFPHFGHLSKVALLQIKNIGEKSIIVKAHGFYMTDGTKLIFPVTMLQLNDKKLESNAFCNVTFPNESLLHLIEKEGQLDSFVVIDSMDTEWKLPTKDMIELKNSLRKERERIFFS